MSDPSTTVAVAHPMALTELACKPQDVLRAAALIQEVMDDDAFAKQWAARS